LPQKNLPSLSLVLASTSPRRRDILSRLCLPFTVVAPRFEECENPAHSAKEEVAIFAEAKGRSVAGQFSNAIIIGSDTLIDCEGEKIGKPKDAADARRILRRLRGRTHTIWTAVAILEGVETAVSVEALGVTMRQVSDEAIDRYVETGEPLDKAGAYAIQGGAASWIERIDGDLLAAIGLPLSPILTFLRKKNVSFTLPPPS
jgi:septum formation protein